MMREDLKDWLLFALFLVPAITLAAWYWRDWI